MHRNAAYRPEYNVATGTSEPYRGTDHTVARMIELARGPTGERSVKVRRHTEQIIGQLRPKDYSSELVAIYRWWGNAGRYTRDPLHVEMLRDPERMIDDAAAGKLSCDCFPEGTLLLRDDFTFLPIENARPGDRIWGRDGWTEITAWSAKGQMSVDAIGMNNGSWMRLTPDHKLFVAHCARHVNRDPEKTRPCYCPIAERELIRVPVSEVEPRMTLIQPTRIAFGAESMDPDRALIEGYYLSDGWSQPDGGFSISGQDGCPKEEQKREVEAICSRLGLATTWHRKSIYVHASDWMQRIHAMGHYAPEKRALSINLDEGAAGALLRGIMADSGANTGVASRTLTTTSRDLMLQARVLLRMFGVSAGYSYIEDHGGLGTNPIYRLSTRQPGENRREKLLRVKEVLRNVATAPCYDITTSDHYVYLPEHDVTVSNCDEYALAIGTGCLVIGARTQFVTVGFGPASRGGPKIHTHVFCRAQDPRTKVWWVLDPVAGRRTSPMLRKVTQFTAFEV